MLDQMTDADLQTYIHQTKAGDAAAFTNIVDQFQRPVYNLCYRMLHSREEAEDAAQEAFLRAYTHLERYDEKRKFSTWLFSIASNYCIDRLRKQNRFQWLAWDESPWEWQPINGRVEQPEAALLTHETRSELHDLLDQLSPEYRAALVLKYWHEMSYEEIADTLNTTVSTIKNRLFRARRKLAGDVERPRIIPRGQNANMMVAI